MPRRTASPRRGSTQRLRELAIDQLRAVGVPAAEIRAAMRRRMTTRDVLALHLAAVEHDRARAGSVSAAIRSALGRDAIDAAAMIRRLDALARAATLDKRERVIPALRAEPMLNTSPVEAAFRDLPDDLTDVQWDAVIELVDLLEHRDVAARAGDDPTRIFDGSDHAGSGAAMSRKLLDDLISQSHGAWVRGDAPTARRGRVLATRWVNHAASLARTSMHAAATDLLERARRHDPRIERVWQLVAIIRGWSGPPAHIAAFRWLVEAVRAHRAQFKR